MLRFIQLLLPALIPSWRFFKAIAPSPRIEWAWDDGPQPVWQEYRPRPRSVSGGQMARRMLWNPHWNQTLFMVTCAERLTADQTDHSLRQIMQRLRMDHGAQANGRLLKFRLVFAHRQTQGIARTVTFQSDPFAVDGPH